jgi:hypothetical protein
MPMKSFRGQIADGDIDTITLHTNTGSKGYRITKFELFPVVQDSAKDNLVCISKIPLTTAITSADFSDNTLLGAALMFNGTYEIQESVIFDNEVFNQDIYISNVDSIGSNAMNYYIELEQSTLSLDENTVATLKDIRNIQGR